MEPARLALEPGMGAVAEVRVSPPQPLVGAVRQQTVQVQASTTQGRRWAATAVFNQAPLLGRRSLWLLGAGTAVIAVAIALLLLAILLAGVIALIRI